MTWIFNSTPIPHRGVAFVSARNTESHTGAVREISLDEIKNFNSAALGLLLTELCEESMRFAIRREWRGVTKQRAG